MKVPCSFLKTPTLIAILAGASWAQPDSVNCSPSFAGSAGEEQASRHIDSARQAASQNRRYLIALAETMRSSADADTLPCLSPEDREFLRKRYNTQNPID